MIARLIRVLDFPITFFFWVALLAACLMMVLVSVDVAARTLFSRPIDGANEMVSAWFMVAIATLPWAWVAHGGGHIVSDVIVRLLPERVIFGLDIFAKLLTILLLFLLCWQTSIRALQQTRAGEVWMAGADFIQVWPSRWLLPISSGLMALYLILRVCELLSEKASTAERPR